jgi:tetratricopeptide (TPR) repeat protein
MKLLLLVLAGGAFAAASEWVRISSPNFEIYTNAGVKDARKTIEYFEQVRSFFMRTKSTEVTTRLPVTIVGFRGAKDYKPYAPNLSAAAYYTGDENRDYIVMSSVGQEDFPVATHEYMHLLIRHSEIKLPVWLDEGIAEVYSSLKPVARKIMIGDVLVSRAQTLSTEKWLTVDALMNVRHDSPEYNEKNRTGILYAQSWLMAHMLMLSPNYNSGFGKFLQVIHDTQSATTAFNAVYKKSLADVSKDLQSYFRSNGVRVAMFDTKLESVKSMEPEPATDIQVGVVLAKLTSLLRRYDEAETRLKELVAKSPTDPEIQEALGHLYWRKDQKSLAREHLGRAVELNAPRWKTYWDFARLAQDAPPNDELVNKALDKAIELNPALTDARLMLGYRYYRAERAGVALATLNQIKHVTSEIAPHLFLLKAHLSLKLKDLDGAKKNALEAKKHSKEPADVQQADNLLAYIAQPYKEQPASRAGTAGTSDGPPRIERRERPATTWDVPAPDPQEQLSSLSGMLSEIECLGEQAKLHVVSNRKKVVFAIKDPSRVFIKRAKEGEQLLTCGKTQRPVSITYLPAENSADGIDGEARIIDFEAAP